METKNYTKVIKLKGRYGDISTLTQISKDRFVFDTKSDRVRVGFDKEDVGKYKFIDPSGGPMISIGSEIDGRKVTSIESIEGFIGYVITLE